MCAAGVIGSLSSLVLLVDCHVYSLGSLCGGIFIVVASVLSGFALGVFITLWSCALARLDERSIILYVAWALIVDRTIYLIGTQCPTLLLAVLVTIAPLVSAWLWVLAMKDSEMSAPSMECRVNGATIKSVPWGLLALLCVCQSICSVFSGLVTSLVGGESSSLVNIFMQVASCLIVLSVVFVLLRRDKASLFGTFWALFILVMAVGVALLLVDHVVIASGVVLAGGYAFVTFYMLLFPVIARGRRLPVMFFVATANLICYRGPEFVGVLAGYGIYSALQAVSVSVATMGVLIMVALFVVLVVEINRNAVFSGLAPADSTNSVQAEPLSLEERVSAVALSYELSEREAEIALFMAKGRSAPYIADALCLSQSTIRTYQRRLYQKLGINNKQELINIVEGADGPAPRQ